MAAPSSAHVSVGKPKAGGAIFAAPADTTVPTDAVAALGSEFKNLGYASEEGLVNSVETDFESAKAWGGDEVLRSLISRSETFQWTFIQTDEDVLKEVYGPDNVTVDDGDITVMHNAKELPRRVYAFEIALAGDRVQRIVVPNAQVGEIGDITYADGEPIGYEVTLSCFPDSAGNTAYAHIAKVAAGGDDA